MPTTIVVHATLPLGWRTGSPDQAPEDAVLLLRVLALLEASPPHADEDDSPEALRWQALEARVDLCLQMVGQLLARGEPKPARCAVSLSGQTLDWYSATPLPAGEQGTVSLWLSPRLPRALELAAQIAECRPEGDGWRIAAQFACRDDELQDWLDKTIFRRHRREIFERKHQTDDDADS